GKDEILKELNAGKKTAMTEFELSSIITHGKEGSASGEFILASGKKIKFCDVYKFHGTKAIIKEMRSFVIEIKYNKYQEDERSPRHSVCIFSRCFLPHLSISSMIS